MKNPLKHTILAAVMMIFAAQAISQENYTIKMTMKMEGLPPEYASMAEQEMVTYIKDKRQKTEMSGMMGSAIIYYDGQKMTSLTDQMGNKKGFTATQEEMEAEDKNDKKSKPKIEYTSEKKNIAGYECTKAVMTTDNKDMKTVVWYTDKIKVDQSHARKANKGMLDLSELKGYPLSMEMSQTNQGVEMKNIITATEVLTTPIDESVFKINTEGYTMVSYKEMKAMQKSMMGK